MRELRKVPAGWRLVRLAEVLEICRNGLACPQDTEPSKGTPVSRIETISDGTIDWRRIGYAAPEHVDPSYLVLKGDILLSHINSVRHIGKVARKQDERPLIHGMNLMLLRFSSHVDASFGFALLEWDRTKQYFERRAKKAVNQASINQKDIRGLQFALPPLYEQEAIAAVLDTIGDAIEHTEAVIAATERLRDALLHELLTCGVSGWMRRQERIAHRSGRYPMRDLSELPDGWRVASLAEIATILTGTTPPRENLDYYGGSTPWLKPSDLANSRFVSTSAECLTDEGVSVARLAPENTVLVSCIGTIGEVSISTVSTCFNQQINALIPGKIVTSSFLYWSCISKASHMERIAAKTAVPILKKSEFSKISIALPPLDEQRAIAVILDSVAESIERFCDVHERQLAAKCSLLDALLAGRVRTLGRTNRG